MKSSKIVIILTLPLFAGCTAAQPDSDILGYTIVDGGAASTAEDTPSEETDEAPDVSGCDWAKGSWELTECAGNTITLELVINDGCSLQVISTN